MTLRQKTISSVVLTLLGLLAVLLVISQSLILGGFRSIEEQRTKGNMDRVLKAFEGTLEDLDAKASDWAVWDDTYRFVKDGNGEYIKSNLTDSTFTGLKVTGLAFVDSSGKPVWSRGFDLNEQKVMPISKELMRHLSPGSPLLKYKDPQSGHSGIVLLSEGPVFLISRPIITSEGEGPIRGSFVLARRLDDREIKRLEHLTNLSIKLHRPDKPLPADIEDLGHSLTASSPIGVRPKNGDVISACGLQQDIYGKPCLVVQVDQARDIYRYGKTSMLYFLLVLLGAGMVFGVITVFMLEKGLLSRFSLLSEEINGIRSMTDLSARFTVRGNDELAAVVREINGMLEKLEWSQLGMQEALKRFESVVDNTPLVAVQGLDRQGVVRHWNRACKDLYGFRADEAMGKPIQELILPSDAIQEFEQLLGEIWQHGKPTRPQEWKIRTREGETRWVYSTMVPVSENGKVVEVFCMDVDVTERKTMEVQLLESQRMISTLVGNLPGMAFRCRDDQDWTMEYVSEGCLDLTGYWPTELEKNSRISYAEIIHPDDREYVWNEIQAALKDKRAYQVVYRIRTINGEEKWVREQGRASSSPDGQLQSIEGFISDTTDSKLAEEAIMTSEANYRAVFDAVNDGILALDVQSKQILDLNRKACEIFGYGPEELCGQSTDRIKANDWTCGVADAEERMYKAATGEPQLFEWRGRRKSGEAFWCEVNLKQAAIGGENRLLAVVRDITERKQSEEELRQSRQMLRLVLDSIPVLVFWKNRESIYMGCNKRFATNAGLDSPEAIVGKSDFDLSWQGDQAERFRAADRAVMESGTPKLGYHEQETIADGSSVWIEINKIPLKDADGRIIGVLGTAEDVTDRRRAKEVAEQYNHDLAQREEALQKANIFQQKLLSTAATAIFTIDCDQKITSINESFTAITGYREEDILGKHCCVLEGDPCKTRCGLFDPNRTNRIIKKQCSLAAKDGRRLIILKSAELIRDEEGNVTGGIESFVDVTELVNSREAAEAASKAKSIFLANMSHEIRTPMNGIIGMTNLALETELSIDQREYLAMVRTSADSLLAILNDILDFSKIEAGKLDLVPLDFNLRDAVCDTVSSLSVRADAKRLELLCHVLPDVPEYIIGDPGRLRQIIVNLVGNAIKFTEQGEIAVEVGLDSQTDDDAYLNFSVRDTGIGIAKEKQAVIFDAFTQVDGSSTRKYDGTGLGLAISAQLVEMMGGRIWVESEPGQGSTFHFTARFGLQKTPNMLPSAASPEQLHGLSVLVVDDNQTNRILLEENLTRWGMKPELAAGGKEGLSVLNNARDAGQPIPLILVDMQMPGMDGFEFIQEMNRNKMNHAAVIMLSSAGQRGDASRCEGLGIAGYLTKPVKTSDLLQAVLIALGMESTPGEKSRLITRHTLREARRSLRILLAEDNPINQKLTVRMMEKLGHSITVANNGREAVEFLARERVDLVLMDVQMPEMGGFEATQIIREREQSAGEHIPIIAMTAHAMKGDKEKCLEAGMDGYVTKPVQREALLDAIDQFVPGLPASNQN